MLNEEQYYLVAQILIIISRIREDEKTYKSVGDERSILSNG